MTMRQRSLKDTGRMPSDSETCEKSALTISRLSILSAEDSRARTLAMPEREQELPANVPACGLSLPGSFASFDPATSSWRTSQRCFLEGWMSYSETWPRAGMMRNGIAFRRQPLAPITSVIAFSSLRTPTASDTPDENNESTTSGASVRPPQNPMKRTGLWPTPLARDATKGPHLAEFKRENPSLAAIVHVPDLESVESSEATRAENSQMLSAATARGQVSGQLSPTWVEWLMGFPIGWTA